MGIKRRNIPIHYPQLANYGSFFYNLGSFMSVLRVFFITVNAIHTCTAVLEIVATHEKTQKLYNTHTLH